MNRDILPTPFLRFPTMRAFFDEEEEMASINPLSNTVSISEDEKHVFVEVAVPGVPPKEVEITFDKGILWIKGELKEEETKRKYYRKATQAYSYRIAVPGDIDINKEPEATSNHGVMTVTFMKSQASQPKKITVKE